MVNQRLHYAGALLFLGLVAPIASAQITAPEPGVATGFTAGSPYSFRPLEPWWSYYAMPPAPPRYARLNDSAVFLTSINYPGVYGAYTFGATPTVYYDSSPFINPAAAPGGFSTLTTGVAFRGQAVPNPRTALIDVLVPAYDAELTFDSNRTTPGGPTRQFVTPPLLPGSNYVYNVRTTWTEDGVQRTRDKNVYVQAGDRLTVDLTSGRGTYEGPSLRVAPQLEERPTLRTRPPSP